MRVPAMLAGIEFIIARYLADGAKERIPLRDDDHIARFHPVAEDVRHLNPAARRVGLVMTVFLTDRVNDRLPVREARIRPVDIGKAQDREGASDCLLEQIGVVGIGHFANRHLEDLTIADGEGIVARPGARFRPARDQAENTRRRLQLEPSTPLAALDRP